MAENKKTEISVESAVAAFSSALEKAHEINVSANESLKALLGAFIGGAAAFAKRPMKLNAFFAKALKALRADKELKAYSRKFEDYVTHEIGVTKTEDGYELTDNKKLSGASEAMKTASLVTYVSAEKAAEAKEKEEQKKAEKAEYANMGAKDQVKESLLQLLANEKDILAKLDKKIASTAKVKPIADRNKAEKRVGYVKELIAKLENIA